MRKEEHLDYTGLQAKLAGGCQVTFKTIYDGLSNQLYQFSFSIVHNREIAEEVVQDVFTQLWHHRNRLDPIINIRFWLFVATRNAALSQLRKQNHNRSFSLEEIKLPFWKIEASPEDIYITKELLHRINLAVNNLPQQCRLVFKLVKQDGLKYREVAELLQIQVKTVENHVALAMKRLHAALPPGEINQKSSTG